MKKIYIGLFCLLSVSTVFAQQKSWDGIHKINMNTVSLHFKNPPADYANHVIWGLTGDMTDDIIRHDLDSIKGKGFKSVILEAGYKLPCRYLSDEYFLMIKRIVKEAKKRDLKIWIIDEGKYPSGFAGGKFSRERPDLRMQALVTCGNIIVKPCEIIKNKKLDDFVISAVAVNNHGKQNIIVPIVNHTINFSAGMDEWNIILVRSDFRTGQTRSIDSPTGAKDTRNSQMDYLNPKAVRQFIEWTHEQYKKYIGSEFGKTVMGFRGDEPDYSHVPFTPEIINEFKKQKGYDVTPYLASFFASSMTEKERMVKADYQDVWSMLFADSFFLQQAEWCKENGLAHVTHLNNDHDMPACVRTEGNLFRDLSKVQIPGIDAIWNQIWPDTVNDYPKFASSVSHVYGKPRSFSESFAAYYNSPTIPQAKYVVDYQMVRGINFFEYMFWMAGSKNPTWMTDPGMKKLNEYSNRMVYLLSQGKPGVRVAVYYPVSTLWMGDNIVADRIKKISHKLLEHQVDFDYVTDDAFVNALTVDKGKLKNKSEQSYETLIIPSSDVISAHTDSMIKTFVKYGGKVLYWGSRPYFTNGKTFTELHNYQCIDNTFYESSDDWTSSVEMSMPDPEIIIKNRRPLEIRERKKAGERRPSPVNGTIDIRYNHRVLSDADVYFLFNEGHRNQSFSIGLDNIGTVELLNADDGTSKPLISHIENNRTWVDVDMKEWGAMVLVVKKQNKKYDITKNGAKGDGITINTSVIQKTIDDAYLSGGGTIVIPNGIFLSGALFFKPGVNLTVEKGAQLVSTVDDNDFPIVSTRFEGIEQQWKSAFLNFTDCKDIIVNGEGTIDGKGVEWKEYSKGKDFFKSFGRPRLMCFTHCDGGKITGVHLKDQASWGLHVLYTDSFIIDNVDIRANHTIPSSDGIDIDSSTKIKVNNCYIEDNDDCISIKSGKDDDGRRVARSSEDIKISNCRFGYGHSGVDIGSEVSGDIRNIYVTDCVMESGNEGAVRIKSQPSRGGIIENVTFKNITLDNSSSFLDVNMAWRMKGNIAPDAVKKTKLRNIKIENVSGRCNNMGRIYGYEDDPITDFYLINCNVKSNSQLDIKNAKIKF